MIYIGNIHSAKNLINKNHIDEAWVIVRSLKTMPKLDVPLFHVPDLSPSRELFHDYLSWRDHGLWNKTKFIKEYVPRFLNEMHYEANRNALNALWFAQREKHILLLCYCAEEQMCHRSIVAGLLQGVTFKGEKATVVCPDYSFYYNEYKRI